MPSSRRPGKRSSPLPPQAVEVLRSAGLRLTAQRRAVLEMAWGSPGHFSADDLWYRLRQSGHKVSRATVYRTLALLTRLGLLRELRLRGGASVYERVDTGLDHEHLVCSQCGRVVEFSRPELAQILAEESRKHGFTATGHMVQVWGLCAQCRRKARLGRRPPRLGQAADLPEGSDCS